MAEVKRVSGPMKPPSFNPSSSSTYKHIYDDVFASPAHSRQMSSTFIDDDYAEMFGSSRSNNGSWSISYSSVPVLDLPPPSEIRIRGGSGVTTIAGERGGGEVDYGGVFSGGSGSGGIGGFGLPDGEELFCMFEKRAKTSPNGIQRSKGQRAGASKSVLLKQSQQACTHDIPESAQKSLSSKSCEFMKATDWKRLEPKSNELLTRSGEVTNVARVCDIPGSTQKSLSSKSCEFMKAADERHLEPKDNELPTRSSEVTKVARARDIPGSSQKSLSSKSFKFMKAADEKHSEQKSNEALPKWSGELFQSASDLDVSGSNSADEYCPARKSSSSRSCVARDDTQMDEASNPAMNPEKHSRRTISDLGVSVPNDGVDGGLLSASRFHGPVSVDTSQKQGTHSRHDSSDFGHTQPEINVNLPEKQAEQVSYTASDLEGDQQDTPSAGFRTECNLSGLSSVDTSQGSGIEAGPSKRFDNDVVGNGFDVKRRKGRHSRITSLDLGGHKNSGEFDGGLQRKPRFGSSYSFDASHDPCAARIKVQPSMMAPSSSVPQFFPVESHYKISENSSFTNFETNLYRGSGGSPPSLAEQLDMNSAAAVSAAALKKAIEEAAMKIRLAKEFLEREGQGSGTLTFKDTLKVTSCSDNQLADEMAELQQTKTYETCPPVGSEMRTYSFRQRNTIMESSRPTPVFELKKVVEDVPVCEDQKKFVQEEERLGLKSTNISELIDESDGREGMKEWEAAKQLNQLISGVKNRIASFMAWQTDTEKKEEPKATGADVNSHQLPDRHEPDMTDAGTLKTSRIEKDRDGTTCIGESKRRIASKAVEPNLPDTISSKSVKQEKAENRVVRNSKIMEPASASFMFFPFRNGRLCDPTGSHFPEEESRSFRERRELDIDETVSRQALCDPTDPHPPEQETSSSQESRDLDSDETVARQVLCDPSDPHPPEEEKSSFQERRELDSDETVDRQVLNEVEYEHLQKENSCFQESRKLDSNETVVTQVLNEVKYENLQGQYEEQDREGLDDACITDNNVRQDDTIYFSGDSSNNEVYDIVEEPHSMVGQESDEANHEEGSERTQDVDWREEPTIDSCYVGSNTENFVENGSYEESEMVRKAESWQDNVDIPQETNVGVVIDDSVEATEEIYVFEEIEREQSKTDVIEEAADKLQDYVEIKTNESVTDHNEEIEEDVAETASCVEEAEDVSKQTECTYMEAAVEDKSEETSFCPEAEDDHKPTHTEHIEEIAEVAELVTCFSGAEDESKQTENVFIRKAEEPSRNDDISFKIEDVSSDEENDRMMDALNNPLEFELECKNPILTQMVSELIGKEAVLPCEKSEEAGTTERLSNVANDSFQFESLSMHNDESNVCHRKEENVVQQMESESQDILENETGQVRESSEKLDLGEIDMVSDQDSGKGGAEAVPRRRRWFENGMVGASERPSIVEGDRDPEVLDEFDFAGGVEVHADKPDSNIAEVKVCEDAATAVNQDHSSCNIEATSKRRRWQIKRGEEGLPEPPPLFQGVKVSLEEPRKSIHKLISHSVSDSSLDRLNSETGESLSDGDADVAKNGESDKQNVERAPRRKRWFESGQTAGSIPQLRSNGDAGITLEIDQESKVKVNVEDDKVDSIRNASGKAEETVEPVSEHHRHADEVNKRQKEKEKERVAVERVIREARERAFADARERARREAAERPNVETRQRVPERLGKVPAEGHSSADKASAEAKLRAERAAVERATAEARERAMQRALSEKLSHRSREQAGKFPAEKSSSSDPNFQSSSSYSRSDSSDKTDKVDGLESESAQRLKARLERQSRTMERAAKALEEKNTRDLLARKEQAAKNILADSLDSDIRRWSAGKEGNVRALLSTLQYILGPDSGWQAVSLTDLIAATAVRKTYKKATLCVHPDKLQQRGATIQQKYICEKVFDLLKEAWSKFNPDER